MFRHSPPEMYEVHRAGDGSHGLLALLMLLIFVAAVVAAVSLFLKSRRLSGAAGATTPPVAPRSGVDPALAELRLRYARGEVDRAEYVERAVDLGDTTASLTQSPPQPAAP